MHFLCFSNNAHFTLEMLSKSYTLTWMPFLFINFYFMQYSSLHIYFFSVEHVHSSHWNVCKWWLFLSGPACFTERHKQIIFFFFIFIIRSFDDEIKAIKLMTIHFVLAATTTTAHFIYTNSVESCTQFESFVMPPFFISMLLMSSMA